MFLPDLMDRWKISFYSLGLGAVPPLPLQELPQSCPRSHDSKRISAFSLIATTPDGSPFGVGVCRFPRSLFPSYPCRF